MDTLNLLTKTYGCLRNYWMPNCVMAVPRKTIRTFANWILPKYLSKSSEYRGVRADKVIVSFTSFPARIADVWMVVESLKRQYVRPEKIILWLSEVQFPKRASIPESLWCREDDSFEIRMVKEDIRSHKKYYYVMSEFPEYTFITCDDDVFYNPYMISHLITTSTKYPRCVVANISAKMLFDKNGNILPYTQWDRSLLQYASESRFQIGVGGVLYPPHSLHELTLEKELFMKLTPLADDIWLNTMARLNKTPVVQSSNTLISLPIKNDAPKLSSVNKGLENKNDSQIKMVKNYLKEVGLTDVYSSLCEL